MTDTDESGREPLSTVIVGVCGSGKTTLAGLLRAAGYNARSCAQEHSYVPYLWKMKQPDCTIYLEAANDVVRERCDVTWYDAYLEDERRHLALARQECNLFIDTTSLTIEEVYAKALEYLRQWPEKRAREGPD